MNDSRVPAGQWSVEGDEITWAGRCPWADNRPCVGTDTGRLHISDASGGVIAQMTSEPVNGAAFLDEFGAVSSRSDVIVFKRDSYRNPHLGLSHSRFDHGSRGVIADPVTQAFYAPVGHEGVALMWPERKRIRSIFLKPDHPLDFHRVALAGSAVPRRVVVACRDDGIAVLDASTAARRPSRWWGRSHSDILTINYDGCDVVDAKPAPTPGRPNGIVALDIDGRVIYSPDLAAGPRLTIASPPGSIGEALKLFVMGDHCLVLTDERIACYPNIVSLLADRGKNADARILVSISSAYDMVQTGPTRALMLFGRSATELDVADLIASFGPATDTKRKPAKQVTGDALLAKKGPGLRVNFNYRVPSEFAALFENRSATSSELSAGRQTRSATSSTNPIDTVPAE